jgi:c(7)-type cytochrome triheme protein
MTKKPEEKRVRTEYWDAGREMAWVRVNRLPGTVYFSHAAHVAYGKMDCRECHGDMAQAAEPVTSSQIEGLDMGRCMACHRERSVGADCFTCHK